MASGSSKSNNSAEIDRLALVLAKEPGSKAFIPLAEEYGKAGMWQEAAGVLEDGLKTYPNFITAMVALGRTYDQLNQPVKAKAILEEAVKLSPENLRAHRTLAKIYVAQGAKEAALLSCQVILSVNPHDQEALTWRTSLDMRNTTPPGSSKALAESSPEPAMAVAPTAQPGRVSSEVVAIPAEERTEFHARGDASTLQSTRAAMTRLEQWLAAIRSRRRDGERPHNSAPTS